MSEENINSNDVRSTSMNCYLFSNSNHRGKDYQKIHEHLHKKLNTRRAPVFITPQLNHIHKEAAELKSYIRKKRKKREIFETYTKETVTLLF